MIARVIRSIAITLAVLGLAACGEPGITTAGAASPLAPRWAPGGGGHGGSVGSVGDYDVVRLAGDGSYAGGLNDVGTIVGNYTGLEGLYRAAYWKVDAAGGVTGPVDIGVPGYSSATRVNDAGQVIVRTLRTASPEGFVYDIVTGDLVELPGVTGAAETAPWAISASGIVSGTAFFDDASGMADRPVVWLDPFDPAAGPTLLPLPTGYPEVCGWTHIDDAGDVVALMMPEGGTYPEDCTPVGWTVGGGGSIAGPEILGAPPGFEAFQLNDAGQLAGTAIGWHAEVLQPDGTVVGLDPLPGDAQAGAFGISDPVPGDPAQVAGVSDYGVGSGGDTTAVVWSVSLDGTVSGPVAMPTGKHETSAAAAVNADGWVVGRIVDTRRHTRAAALWMPASSGGGGGSDGGGGGDCVPKGPNGNNCK